MNVTLEINVNSINILARFIVFILVFWVNEILCVYLKFSVTESMQSRKYTLLEYLRIYFVESFGLMNQLLFNPGALNHLKTDFDHYDRYFWWLYLYAFDQLKMCATAYFPSSIHLHHWMLCAVETNFHFKFGAVHFILHIKKLTPTETFLHFQCHCINSLHDSDWMNNLK